jgi:hypothetical protein
MNSQFRLYAEALCNNARIVRDLVESCGMSLVVVLKSGFRSKSNIERLVGVGVEAMSFAEPPPKGARAKHSFSLYPGASRHRDWPQDTIYSEVSVDAIAQLIRLRGGSAGPLDLMIPVLTDDKREGLMPEDIPSFTRRLTSQFGSRVRVRGVQACYGCIEERPPTQLQIQDLVSLVSQLSRPDAPAVLSLGGSVILTELEGIAQRDNVRIEIRVGEAVVAGTIPGRGHLFGLQPTASLLADVVQHRRLGDVSELVVHYGRYPISGKDARAMLEGATIGRRSSEHGVIEVVGGLDVSEVKRVELILGYADTAKCLVAGR